MYLKEGKIVTVQEDDYTKITAICNYNNCLCKVLYSENDGAFCYFNTVSNCIVSKMHKTVGNLIMWEKSNFTPYYDGVEMDLKHGTI